MHLLFLIYAVKLDFDLLQASNANPLSNHSRQLLSSLSKSLGHLHSEIFFSLSIHFLTYPIKLEAEPMLHHQCHFFSTSREIFITISFRRQLPCLVKTATCIWLLPFFPGRFFLNVSSQNCSSCTHNPLYQYFSVTDTDFCSQ